MKKRATLYSLGATAIAICGLTLGAAPASASIEVYARSNGTVESDFSLDPKHAPFFVRGANSFSGTLNKAASSVKLFSLSGKIHLKKR